VRDALFFLFSFGCGSQGKAAVVVVLRLRRMRGGVTAQDLANVCESLDGGEQFIFFQPILLETPPRRRAA